MFCGEHVPSSALCGSAHKCAQTNISFSIKSIVLNDEHSEPLLQLFPNCWVPVELWLTQTLLQFCSLFSRAVWALDIGSHANHRKIGLHCSLNRTYERFITLYFVSPERKCQVAWNYSFHSYSKNQRDALFLIFIWLSTLHVSDRSTVHHQEYLNTVHTQ